MTNLYREVLLLTVVYFGNVLCCDNSWVGHNGMCYLFSHDTESWIGALQICRELGAQLAEVETAEENAYIKSQIKIYAKDRFWIALNDVSEEGSWVWMNSKTPLTTTVFTDWFPGQPDNGASDSNCVAYYINPAHHAPSWQWSDIACYTAHHYICEKADTNAQVG